MQVGRTCCPSRTAEPFLDPHFKGKTHVPLRIAHSSISIIPLTPPSASLPGFQLAWFDFLATKDLHRLLYELRRPPLILARESPTSDGHCFLWNAHIRLLYIASSVAFNEPKVLIGLWKNKELSNN